MAQTGGRVTHFVAGLGTSGTFVGTGRRLREFNPRIRSSRCSPTRRSTASKASSTWRPAIVPGIYDAALADDGLRVGTEEAYAMTRRLAREEGLLVGVSSGAALAAALDVGADRSRTGVIVMIFPDGGERYLRSASGKPPEGQRMRTT